jgi:NAD(P)-dependent dehydrogenase (short-subunit alcohol dehydrogenase family)
MDFSGRVAIITGAGSGLGRSYAHYLAFHGARVVVNDLGTTWNGTGQSRAAAQEVVEEIKVKGGEAVANFSSVADVKEAESIVNDALKHFGTVDILINNAGILRDKTFVKMELEDFEEVLRVHLLGSVYVTRAAYPIMKEKSYGRIIMTTSVAGLYGNFGQTNYSAAKMGIVGFMNSLKLEGKKYNILVNGVAPVAVTRLTETSSIFPQELIPLLKPEPVTALVAYLCSDQCRTSGDIISAGAGYYAKVQTVEGRGVKFSAGEGITPEKIARSYVDICSMNKAVGYESADEQLQALLSFLEK